MLDALNILNGVFLSTTLLTLHELHLDIYCEKM